MIDGGQQTTSHLLRTENTAVILIRQWKIVIKDQGPPCSDAGTRAVVISTAHSLDASSFQRRIKSIYTRLASAIHCAA